MATNDKSHRHNSDEDLQNEVDALQERHSKSQRRADELVRGTIAVNQTLRDIIEAYKRGDEALGRKDD